VPGPVALAHDDHLDAVFPREGEDRAHDVLASEGHRDTAELLASSRFLPRMRWVAASVRVRSSAGVWM